MLSPQQQLFEYLKAILYTPDKASLDISQLPPEYAQLAEGLKTLENYMEETRSYGRALSNGDFSVQQPSGENTIAAPLKSVQSILRHITWQTQQVAKGDYSQRLDFMGEFSQAYNKMVETLDLQRKKIVEEQQRIERRNLSLQRSQDLIMNVAFTMKRGMLILSRDGQIMFQSNSVQRYVALYPKLAGNVIEKLMHCPESAHQRRTIWQITVPGEQSGQSEMSFEVQSQPMTWEGEPATAHVLENTTIERRRTAQLESYAFTDALTGLGNRRYGMACLEKWLSQRENFCVAFIDIDSLKYCNDEFGHDEGDRYLIKVADILSEIEGELMLCRFGGDEFMLAIKNSPEAETRTKLEAAREHLIATSDFGFAPSFSYGICCSAQEDDMTLNDIIHAADKNMYRYKVGHKTNRER